MIKKIGISILQSHLLQSHYYLYLLESDRILKSWWVSITQSVLQLGVRAFSCCNFYIVILVISMYIQVSCCGNISPSIWKNLQSLQIIIQALSIWRFFIHAVPFTNRFTIICFTVYEVWWILLLTVCKILIVGNFRWRKYIMHVKAWVQKEMFTAVHRKCFLIHFHK